MLNFMWRLFLHYSNQTSPKGLNLQVACEKARKSDISSNTRLRNKLAQEEHNTELSLLIKKHLVKSSFQEIS